MKITKSDRQSDRLDWKDEPDLTAAARLDETPPDLENPDRRTRLYENVGWFIGSLFIIAGSVYGVREAWGALGGVGRHLLVAGALFLYHLGFVSLAALVRFRSPRAARFLAAVSFAILPVAFVALASLFSSEPAVATTAALVLGAASLWTLHSGARRFTLQRPWRLGALLVPILCAQLPLMTVPPASWIRLAIPLIGVAAVLLALRSTRRRTVDLTSIAVSIYFALALAVLACAGAVGSNAVRSPGVLLQSAALWLPLVPLTLLTAVVGVAASGRRPRTSFPRVSAVAETLAFVLVTAVGLAAVAARLSGQAPGVGATAAQLAASLLATVFYCVSGRRRAAPHYFAGVNTVVTVAAFFPSLGASPPVAAALVLAAATAVLSLAGLLHQRLANRRPSATLSLFPYDDLALILGLAGALSALAGLTELAPASAEKPWLIGTSVWFALLLQVRAFRDRSRLVSLAGALVLVGLFCATAPLGDLGTLAIAGAATALGLLLVSDLLGRSKTPDRAGRIFFGQMALPWGARGRALLGDVWALVGLGLAAGASALCVALLAQSAAARALAVEPWVLLASVLLLSAACGVIFRSRTLSWIGLRDRTATLTAGVTCASVATMIGAVACPSPALSALLYGAAVVVAYAATAMLRRHQDTSRLGRSTELALILLGSAALMHGAVLWSDGTAVAFWPFGVCAAVAALLWARASRSAGRLHVAWPLVGLAVVVGAAPGSAEGTWLGVAGYGLSIAALQAVFARATGRLSRTLGWLVLDRPEDGATRAVNTLRVWSLLGGIAVGGVALSAAALPSSLLVITAGLTIAFANRLDGALVTTVGLFGLLTALASSAPVVPGFLGLVAAGWSLVLVSIAPSAAPRGEPTALAWPHLLAGLSMVVGLLFTAAGGGAAASPIFPSIVHEGFLSLFAIRVATALPLVLLFGLAAIALVAGMRQWALRGYGRAAEVGAGAALVCIAAGTACGLGGSVSLGPDTASWMLGPFALAAALVAMGLAMVRRRFTGWLSLCAPAMRWARGGFIAASAALVVIGNAMAAPGVTESALIMAAGAAALVVVASLILLRRERQVRYLYLAQAALLGGYLMARSQLGLLPEADSIFTLVLALGSVGLSVGAHRAGLERLSTETRFQAALLPTVLAFSVVLRGELNVAAILAGSVSGVVYAALALTSGVRIFAVLAVASFGATLFGGAAHFGVWGTDLAVSGGGFILLGLVHVAGRGLGTRPTAIVRLLGIVALCLPSAVRMVLEVHGRGSGVASLVLGGIALGAVGMGMALHLRSYLLLGTLFLVLDVLVNLVYVSMESQLAGFVLLSGAGVLILSVMLAVTLRRERMAKAVRRVRRTLKTWAW